MNKWPTADSLRDSLIRFRARHRLTRRDVAAESGIGFYWIEKFEQGVIADPTLSRAAELAMYLKTKRPLNAAPSRHKVAA